MRAQILKGWNSFIPPFQGLRWFELNDSQGVALGCYSLPFQGKEEGTYIRTRRPSYFPCLR